MDETSEQALERLLCGVGDARARLSEALQEQKPLGVALLHERCVAAYDARLTGG